MAEWIDTIFRETEIVSIHHGLGTGKFADLTEACCIPDLISLGELTLEAGSRDVTMIINGLGYMSIDEIKANMVIGKISALRERRARKLAPCAGSFRRVKCL